MTDPCVPTVHSKATLKAWAIWRRGHPLWKAKLTTPACIRIGLAVAVAAGATAGAAAAYAPRVIRAVIERVDRHAPAAAVSATDRRWEGRGGAGDGYEGLNRLSAATTGGAQFTEWNRLTIPGTEIVLLSTPGMNVAWSPSPELQVPPVVRPQAEASTNVPEPSTLALLGAGLLTAAWVCSWGSRN